MKAEMSADELKEGLANALQAAGTAQDAPQAATEAIDALILYRMTERDTARADSGTPGMIRHIRDILGAQTDEGTDDAARRIMTELRTVREVKQERDRSVERSVERIVKIRNTLNAGTSEDVEAAAERIMSDLEAMRTERDRLLSELDQTQDVLGQTRGTINHRDWVRETMIWDMRVVLKASEAESVLGAARRVVAELEAARRVVAELEAARCVVAELETAKEDLKQAMSELETTKLVADAQHQALQEALKTLEARSDESLCDAARRVLQERDTALARLELIAATLTAPPTKPNT